MRRNIHPFGKLLSATVLAAGLHLAPATAADLRVVLPQLPAALDPTITTLGTNWLVAGNACEGLTGRDNNWQAQPMLADSWAYDEAALTLTFKLRTGVKFHSGAVMTSEDVVASLRRYRDSAGTGAVLKQLTADIAADGPDKVVLKLTGPTSIIPGLLTLQPAIIQSKSVLAGKSASQAVDMLDCTGPYKVAEFQPDRQAVLTRFDGYKSRAEKTSGAAGAKTAAADRLIFLPQAEPSVRRDNVLTGAADIAMNLPLDFYADFKASKTADPVVIRDNQSLTAVFNTKKGPLANVAMRRAIYHALEMDPIMMAAIGNEEFYSVDPSWVPDRNSIWYTKAGAEDFGKPKKDLVKKYLAEAGYKGETLRWLTSKDFYQQHYLPALTAKQQLEDFGIKVDLQVMPAATYIQTRSDADKFDIFSSFLPAYVDPVVIPYLNASYPGFWEDPKKADLVKKLASSSDPAARVAIWKDIQILIYDQMPFIKYGTESAFSGARKGLKEVPISPANTDFFVNVVPVAK